MLIVSKGHRDMKEIWGQIVRLEGGGALSLIGRRPESNAVGANVPAEASKALPPGLEAVCDAT